MKYSLLLVFVFISIVYSLDSDESLYHPYLEPIQNIANNNELNSDYWMKQAQENLQEKLKEKLLNKQAKNIIFFLGDGMGINTIGATRSFIKDVSYKIFFEKFPYFGLSKTYCVNGQVADSACTATAFLCGVKGNLGTIGVNAKVELKNCIQGNDKDNHVHSIAKWAQDAQKGTGIVTTTRITHASTAGIYAHSAHRNWESDSQVEQSGCDPKTNKDIAQQLIHSEVGKKLKVILGGGRSMFLHNTTNDEEGVIGNRSDGRNLIKEWLKDRKTLGKAAYVWNRKQLLAVDVSKTDYLLGLVSANHCPYNGDRLRIGLEKSDPSLSEMTETAIKMLQKEKNGYFLFVEGGRIDHAHHAVNARRALEDTEEFAKAVELAYSSTSKEDTLIVVTSDHSHTLTINGYPYRGSDILGLSGGSDSYKKPYTTLSYANGPGHFKAYPKNEKGHRDISFDNFVDPNYEYAGTVPTDVETHAGEDVGIFAIGPNAHRFVGNYEQSNIPMLMAYAAKIGPYMKND